jgi:ABC-type antimicrobial peptide transport system permease subunit
VFAPRVVTLVVRNSRGESSGFGDEIRQAISAVDANVAVAQLRTLGTLYRGSMARTSFTLVMLAIAAATALLLGVVGIYGAIGYLIAQRRREIGVRVALGADHRGIRWRFVRHGVALTAAGVGCGLLAASALTRFMTSMLFGIGPLDGVTFAVVAVVMLVTAALASYVPARRATLVDPIDALRAES